jgi:hypothetical protein
LVWLGLGTNWLASGVALATLVTYVRPRRHPVDWWSDRWIEDRIVRKLREAGTPATQAAAPPIAQ